MGKGSRGHRKVKGARLLPHEQALQAAAQAVVAQRACFGDILPLHLVLEQSVPPRAVLGWVLPCMRVS